jgi:hypothetical protein
MPNETGRSLVRSTAAPRKLVALSFSFSRAADVDTIKVASTKPFAKGGEMIRSGVTSQDGTALTGSDTTSTILANAKGIVLG